MRQGAEPQSATSPNRSQRYISHGLAVMGGFIIGFDSDPPDVFQRQVNFIQKNGIVTAMVGLLTAIPGTRLYSRLESEGRMLFKSSGEQHGCRADL